MKLCFFVALLTSCDLPERQRGELEEDMATPCNEIQCYIRRDCPADHKTTITGKVYAPNGTLPLYNVAVYVPGAELEPFTQGVSCDRCDGRVSRNAAALSLSLSKSDGSFTLTDVPGVGEGTPAEYEIPVVFQAGRWRRKIMVPAPQHCTTEDLSSQPDKTRLPKNKDEGEIPLMAITSGQLDPFECLLRKIGIAADEITIPSKSGRVHFYRGFFATDHIDGAPPSSTLWSDAQTLAKYDLVILPCEGGEIPQSAQARANIAEYTRIGGRVFTTHYSYVWLTYPGSPFNVIGAWMPDQKPPLPTTFSADIDVSFPKGKAFADWLTLVGASASPTSMTLEQPARDINSVDSKYAQRWLSAASPESIFHVTFNTPVDPPLDAMGQPEYCGRVVYSDFHVSLSSATTGEKFPNSCPDLPLTNQEKALAFMMFDLSSCVQKDSEIPIP